MHFRKLLRNTIQKSDFVILLPKTKQGTSLRSSSAGYTAIREEWEELYSYIPGKFDVSSSSVTYRITNNN